MSMMHAYRDDQGLAPAKPSGSRVACATGVTVSRSASGDNAYPWLSATSAQETAVVVQALVVARIGCKMSALELVEATGLSESTLRRAILAETGLQLAPFVMNIKLDQVRSWLSSNRESRSLGRIATAVGMRSASALSRAYARRFGETISQTRKYAVEIGEDKNRPLNSYQIDG